MNILKWQSSFSSIAARILDKQSGSGWLIDASTRACIGLASAVLPRFGRLALIAFAIGLVQADASQAQVIMTVAGGGVRDGHAATDAILSNPSSVAVDFFGNLYIADTGNGRIRKVAPDGLISTAAGGGVLGLGDSNIGIADMAVRASLAHPTGVAVDAAGSFYVADQYHQRIRKVTPRGEIYTIAGSGVAGFSGDGGSAGAAKINNPQGVAVDGGTIYIADRDNNRIRKVTSNGIISTVAGNGTAGFSGDGGLAINARINQPYAIAVGAGGVLYIADRENNRIRKVTPDGIISTLAGNGVAGFSGDGGLATNSSLNHPEGVAIDASGNLFIADFDNLRLRKVTPAGTISTVAGTGNYLSTGGGDLAINAGLRLPSGVTVDNQGNIFIAEFVGHRIRQITPDGTIRTVAGSVSLRSSGDGGLATEASLTSPEGAAYGADGSLYIADTQNNRIRVVSPDGVIRTIAGSDGIGFSGDGGPATGARLSEPNSIALGNDGDIYISDSGNSRIRKIDRIGIITTVAGNGFNLDGDGIPATSVDIRYPEDIAVDANGTLYIAESGRNRIRKVSIDGIISTVAGNGMPVSNGDGGLAVNAGVRSPNGIAVGADGTLYIVEALDNKIRKVDPNGIIHTIAGTGIAGFSGDGGPAIRATLNAPEDIAVGSDDRLFIADSGNRRIRMIARDGTISTIVGNGLPGFSGDGERALNASLSTPETVVLGQRDEIYIVEANHRIRKVAVIAPSAPFLGAPVPGDTQATVTIFPPLSDGGSAITGYTVTSNPAGGIDSNAGSTGLVHVITGLVNDTAYTFTATATNVAGIGPASDATNAITPRAVVLTVNDVTVVEGDSGITPAVFTISLSRPAPAGGVTFGLSVTGRTAQQGFDFAEHKFGPMTIPEGKSSTTLVVSVFGDTQVELDETFLVNIINVTNATGADKQGVGTILNDDMSSAPPIAIADTYWVTSGETLSVDAPLGVLFNDRDQSATRIYVVRSTTTAQGTLSLQSDGAFTYISKPGYSGIDSFTYRVCDLIDACANGSVTFIVQDVSPDAQDHYLWLVPPASNGLQQGFLRLVNREGRAGTVTIWGLDAEGIRSSGIITLTLSPHESRQINSQDLEFGNAAKGLVGNLGDGVGDWTVVIHSDLDLEPLAYIRTPDGFLTSMHDRVVGDGVDWLVPMFNPADNQNQSSHLRIVNTSTVPVSVQIRGVDDAGKFSTGMVTLTLAALASADLSSEDLERGNPGKGLIGLLGDGQGKWQLKVSATDRVTVQSLLFDPKGYLTNLSTLPDLSESVPGERTLWLAPPASNSQQQGFVRVINRENRAGDVALWGIDDAGNRSSGTITFTLSANESRQFNAQDLETGNPAKGMTGRLGAGVGNWRLVVLSDLDIAPMALVRTPDGFLTSIHDVVAGGGLSLHIPMFNPAENPNQVSLLRLVNPNATAVSVTIRGVDDAGHVDPGGDMTLTLAAGMAIELSAADLELGNAALGLNGRLGDGTGKWTLTVTATAPIKAMNLLRDPKGYLTNLSGSTIDGSGKLDP